MRAFLHREGSKVRGSPVENGALRALVPRANKAQLGALPEEAAERMNLVFYGDVARAVCSVGWRGR